MIWFDIFFWGLGGFIATVWALLLIDYAWTTITGLTP